jgi:hypothetical protein
MRDALPPLPYSALCLDEKTAKAAFAHLKAEVAVPWVTPSCGATTHVLQNPAGDLTCVVCLAPVPKKTTYEQVAALLIHEAVHVWQHYRDDVLREPKPCSELEAYTIQRIAQNLLEAYAGQRSKP